MAMLRAKSTVHVHPAEPDTAPAFDAASLPTARLGTHHARISTYSLERDARPLHYDEEEFPNSYKFEPDRFMTEKPGQTDGTDSVTLGEGMYRFGFGRQECPGQQMGTKSAWIAIVRLLWAFDIEAVLDVSGKPIDTETCTQGLICNFVAGSAGHIETIISS
ncbi:hypothetical protein B0H14DRAFT_3499054 [Mycena olivaceomarginata]|nr:hypothetical protein B0H14DRAFT_3499054 [Mycena olivaceomarginata]